MLNKLGAALKIAEPQALKTLEEVDEFSLFCSAVVRISTPSPKVQVGALLCPHFFGSDRPKSEPESGNEAMFRPFSIYEMGLKIPNFATCSFYFSFHLLSL